MTGSKGEQQGVRGEQWGARGTTGSEGASPPGETFTTWFFFKLIRVYKLKVWHCDNYSFMCRKSRRIYVLLQTSALSGPS